LSKSKYYNHPGEVDGYTPPKHENTTNYRLAGKGVLQANNMEIIMGVLGEGGEAKYHSHAGSEQSIFVLEGSVRVEVGDEVIEVGPDGLIYIPVGVPHRLLVKEKLRCLVLYSPPLKDW